MSIVCKDCDSIQYVKKMVLYKEFNATDASDVGVILSRETSASTTAQEIT